MLCLHASLNMFLDDRWSLGSLFFSLGDSVKTNLLLFSPGLLSLYIIFLGARRSVLQLVICASVQLILALPSSSPPPPIPLRHLSAQPNIQQQ